GHGPVTSSGVIGAKVGDSVTVERAREAALATALSMLATVQPELFGGDVDPEARRSTRSQKRSARASLRKCRKRRERSMTYVDGLGAGVPTANREKYRIHAEKAAGVCKEHGALEVVECGGDDVPDGEVTSFPMAVKCKADETVVFSWILWPSRQARDEGMKKVMADPRLKPDVNPMPFDGKRLIFGGFEMIVEA